MEATEQREVSLFNTVDFRGIGMLILSQGEKRSVTVTASEVVLPHVRTEVRDGVLIVSFRWWPGMLFRIAEMKTLEVQLIVEELAGLKVSGAGVVQSREKIQVKEMDIRLTGAGEISLELQGHRIRTRLTGVGSIVLWGEAEEQEIHLTGAGSIQAENLVTRGVRVHTSGVGECRIHATETLDARLSGAGSIRYRGNPKIQSRMTGLGTLATMD